MRNCKPTASMDSISRAAVTLTVIHMILGLLTGCALPSNEPTSTPGVTATITPTHTPEATTTPAPLGSAENPLIMAIVAEPDNQAALDAAITTATTISAATGYQVQAQSFPDYPSVLTGLEENRIHITWLPPITYIYAAEHRLAEVILLTNHFGVYLYGTQYFANVSSGMTIFFDPERDTSTAPMEDALAQFAGKRPCWTEPSSASGMILPAGLILQQGIQLQDPVMVQTHTAVLRSLWVRGLCDFGATYAHIGDPRTSSTLQDLPGLNEQVVIVWRSEPFIPNLNVSVAPGLPAEIKAAIATTLVDHAKTPEGQLALSTANQYDILDLKPYDDSIYDPLREALRATGSVLYPMIGK